VKRVAAVTDAVSPDFYFRPWHRYYGGQFGNSNLYVVAPEPEIGSFAAFELGGVLDVGNNYNNAVRAAKINDVVTELLKQYDFVVRTDADEFLVADPAYFDSLRHYVDSLAHDHVTAYGLNVIPGRDQKPLNLAEPMLFHQRNLAHPYNALSKTCVTAKPLVWSPGFHYCSEMPLFDRLFLFHMKLADIDIQVQIGERVAGHSDEERFIEYHKTARDVLQHRLNVIRSYQRVTGKEALYRREYTQKFLEGFSYTENYGGIYCGSNWDAENILVELGPEFGNAF